ncbi:MAG: hypothetical protein JSV41_06175 [Gemmatimonadota bacterium]|nr:MAG: hypothetical protein JSV41_06175 [Gemmatimonadota bacterium]
MVEPQARTDRLCRLLALTVATAAFGLRFKGVWFGYPLAVRIGREHYTPPVDQLTDDYEVLYLGYYGLTRSPAVIQTTDYVILSSTDYDRFVANPERYPREAELYLTFFAENQLVKEFVPDSVTLGGPTIRIYRVGH